MSRPVLRDDTAYLSGVVPDPVGDDTSRTRQVLEKIELLLGARSDRSKQLTAQIRLAGMSHFATMNDIWNAAAR